MDLAVVSLCLSPIYTAASECSHTALRTIVAGTHTHSRHTLFAALVSFASWIDIADVFMVNTKLFIGYVNELRSHVHTESARTLALARWHRNTPMNEARKTNDAVAVSVQSKR